MGAGNTVATAPDAERAEAQRTRRNAGICRQGAGEHSPGQPVRPRAFPAVPAPLAALRTNRFLRGAASIACALALLACPAAPAAAGQNCEARRPTVASMQKDLALAASVALQLDELAAREGARVVVIARAGQNLAGYGLRWSHLGIAYRDEAALDGRGAWRVVHKLNQCGSDRSGIYRQGLAEFFGDGLYAHEAGVAVLAADLAARLLPQLTNDALLARLHEPRYNMLAYPWSGPYQQSNQWALETLALFADAGVNSRADARAWLRAHDYRPQTIQVPTMKRLGARIATAHIAFDDHPFDRRMAGRIDTVTVESVFDWLPRAGFAEAPRVLRTRASDLRVPATPAAPITPGAPAGPRAPVTPRLERTEVELLQRTNTALLGKPDAARADAAEFAVGGVAQRKGRRDALDG